MPGSYDTAQICLNGHVTNAISKLDSEANQDHCGKCGEQTITACVKCGSQIRGTRLPSPDDAFYDMSPYEIPGHCRQCGVPFPWTQRRLDAACILAEEFEKLSPDDREKLAAALPNLLAETPKTPAAELIFKRLIKKAGDGALDAMRRILIDVLSESVRKSLFGG